MKFKAKVTSIKNHKSLHIVEFEAKDTKFLMMSLEVPTLKKGVEVELGVKPTSLIVAKNFSGAISLSNRFKVVVKKINLGELLCSLKLDFRGIEFESIMTKEAFMSLHVEENEEIEAFIKASELFVRGVLND